jgi:hypothetical protein
MKIVLTQIDSEQFMVHPHDVNGEIMYLIQPQHIGCKWTQANRHLRSSLWTQDGELVSAGFPKFVNWGENPDNFPVPTSLKDTNIVEKIDGSLLIVSKWKGNYILRTRGTVDAFKMDNGYELEIFKETVLSKIIGSAHDVANGDGNWDYSLLFEWVSPAQRIILSYGDQPNWYLVGMVDHDVYQLLSQDGLDRMAEKFEWNRPVKYSFPTVEDLIKNVELFKGKEGVVVYSKHDQVMHKVKGVWYLALHRMKEALASIDKVIDVWFEQGRPSYQDMQTFVTSQFDYELWTQVQGDVSRICDAWKEVNKVVQGIEKFVNDTLLPMPTRKDQAVRVLSSYGNTNRASFVFKRLDKKPLDDDDLKKIMYQVMKK